MNQTHIMHTLLSAQLSPIYEAQTFGALMQAIAESVAALLGSEAVQEVSLVLFDEEPPAGAYVINALTLHKRRNFRPFRLKNELAETLQKSPQLQLMPWTPAQMLQLLDNQVSPLSAAAEATLIVPVGMDHRRAGLLTLGLAHGELTLDPAVRESLLQIGAVVGRIAPKILHYELIEIQSQQIQHLHESLFKVMVSFDKSTLLSSLLGILNRQFGFSRVIIAQVHSDTQTLRSELHSGFSASFVAFTIPLEDTHHFLVHTLSRGEVVVFDGDRGGIPCDLPSFIGESRIERGVILPLKVGAKQIGLIYADQPIHDGAPLFKYVLEVFARMAAAALENLNLRIRAEQRAETDALTGLYNRYFLNKVLELEIPRVKRYNHSISLLMIDLCDFKRFNDTYGHQFGDYILRETSSLIQANVRRPDIVVRYGGDEFVVLMVNTTIDQARLVRDRIEQSFVERNRLQTDEKTAIKISMGLRSADAETIESLLHEADMEMYAHKARQTRAQLIEALMNGCIEKIEMADRIVGSLCNILYKKAPYYSLHARRVMNMSIHLARRLDLSESELEELALGALLHDVGKVSIPTELLQKVDPLTVSEITAMRHHPALGEEFFHGIEYLDPIRPIIRSHHERFDGRTAGKFPGYPDGLCGDRIPLAARILKIAESAECMLSGRSYMPARSPEEVARLLQEEAGKSFDPHLVSILLADQNWTEFFSRTESFSPLVRLDLCR